MMKTKTVVLALASALLLSNTLVSVASAQSIGEANIRVNVNANVGVHEEGNATSSDAQATDVRSNATSTSTKTDERGNVTSTSASANGELTSDSQISTVASFVRSLLLVADREGGIGAQVRAVAISQQNSASTSANAIARVEDRNQLSTLLFGSDYHSLGELRSEMATTSANIAQLKNLITQATNNSDKVELLAQTQVLEDSQAKIATFVQAHENSFSFFGWFVKIFAK